MAASQHFSRYDFPCFISLSFRSTRDAILTYQYRTLESVTVPLYWDLLQRSVGRYPEPTITSHASPQSGIWSCSTLSLSKSWPEGVTDTTFSTATFSIHLNEQSTVPTTRLQTTSATKPSSKMRALETTAVFQLSVRWSYCNRHCPAAGKIPCQRPFVEISAE